MNYKVGTRGSTLSLAQTNIVISKLQQINPNNKFDIKIIKTKGDVDPKPIFMIDQKGIFEKEIDAELLKNNIDFAVHSLKDVPTNLPPNLIVCCVPKRGIINDVFISNDNSTINDIKKNAIIGTSSLRRAIQIKLTRSDILVKPIRGNIESRIEKIKQNKYDAIIIAESGLKRINHNVRFSRLSLNSFPPSPCQGTLGITCNKHNNDLITQLKTIEHKNSRIEANAERSISAILNTGCKFPISIYAKIVKHNMHLSITAYSVDGNKSMHIKNIIAKNKPYLINKIINKKKKKLFMLSTDWRQKIKEWNKI